MLQDLRPGYPHAPGDLDVTANALLAGMQPPLVRRVPDAGLPAPPPSPTAHYAQCLRAPPNIAPLPPSRAVAADCAALSRGLIRPRDGGCCPAVDKEQAGKRLRRA